ncbi:MAG: phospholipid carrier-dependent glycosyltransferase [Chloroflexi bacterium]|nr:phospholipid carrier-dependent glycosyltransferase [Chloroflexota bacterium]MBP7043640.1 phospholipid carrier-dependent glycosyltransferase [Chloroflexota bacterium]
MNWRVKVGLWSTVGLTAVLRFHALFANTFHADEALFATWARYIATWRDPLLLTQAIDKPPLLFYLQALFYLYPVLGPTEIAARLPNFIASILLVPLVGVWAWRLYGDEVTAVLAVLLLALSPFAIQFSATAFTDPLLTFWLVVAFAAVVKRIPRHRKIAQEAQAMAQEQEAATQEQEAATQEQEAATQEREATTQEREAATQEQEATAQEQEAATQEQEATVPQAFLAAFFFSLAVAAKYQAWLFLPLLLGLGWLQGWRRRDWVRFVLGLLPVLALLLAWDAVRGGGLALWSAQMGNYGGVRLIWSWELWPRLAAWLRMWRWLFVSPIWALIVGAAVIRPFFPTFFYIQPPISNLQSRHRHYDQLFTLFIAAYFLLHWFLAVPVWDRYLLPLLPLAALLVARLLTQITRSLSALHTPHSALLLFELLLLITLLLPAWGGRNGRYPIGGQPQADGGAAQIAALLDDAPYGTVLYDHWYSWQWGYHLFWRRVYVNWLPDPAVLAEDLTVFGDDGSPRYLVLPLGEPALPFRRAVADAGFQLKPISTAAPTTMQLYRIER